MTTDEIAEFFNDPNWHQKRSTKANFVKKYADQLKGEKNPDFWIDKGTNEILLKGVNKKDLWVKTGIFLE